MKIFLLICFVGLIINGYSQDTDTFQPDSVFSKNRVKSRREVLVGQESKAAIIIDYDRLGRRVKYTLTDNETGKVPQMIIIFLYDQKGRLSTETTYYSDSTIEKATYSYDNSNRVIKKVSTIGKSVIEIDNITYTPNKVSKGIYFDETGKVYKKDTVCYTKGALYNNYRGYEIRDGKKNTWNYHLKASYDSLGRLSSNVYITNGKEGYGDYYFYDQQGLLIKQQSGSQNPWTIKKFEYTFWD